jgi:hypothetical protein
LDLSLQEFHTEIDEVVEVAIMGDERGVVVEAALGIRRMKATVLSARNRLLSASVTTTGGKYASWRAIAS